MAFVEAFLEIFGRPTVGAIVLEMMIFLGPVWIAFFLGIMVGWAWKPRWASFDICKFDGSAPSSPPALIPSPVKMGFGSTQNFDSIKVRTPNPSFASSIVDTGVDDTAQLALQLNENPNCSSSHLQKDECRVVKEEDFEHLCHLVERKDGGPPWKHIMDRSSPRMSYQAWQRDPEIGPPQYCSRTVYEDATPELLRDFFWDDEFRLEWDDMLLHAVTIEECPTTGTMVLHWIRKFPFFCSDREYTIGRRIWESGRTYYCVTKWRMLHNCENSNEIPVGVEFLYGKVINVKWESTVLLSQGGRNLDEWTFTIQVGPFKQLSYLFGANETVGSRKGNGHLTACEVMLFHHEDMGIPGEIAKFGIRQGMWAAVKKIERGLRAYQKVRASGAPLSRTAFMAQINTKIDPDYLKSLESDEDSTETEVVGPLEKPTRMNVPKLVLIGAAVGLACSLDRGLLTKAVIFGVARRFANLGRRACPRT
ncbi:hypothetical protein RJ640_028316 [Escallonia rubra]|uniref:START domain-containing protein n=1 Tax=Escallonia rubra TaxID=112253 RepID=A0AA88QTF0_9ASTE|nr:hypothetical protein RJ640_028316 [Escallonia rubra]